MTNLPHFSSKVFLAPIAGVSDAAFRLLCREMGAGLCFTELISIHAVAARENDFRAFVEFSDKEKPRAIQLFGSDLKVLEKAVKIVSPHFDIIDYNMGCPAPQINEQKAGAILMKEPELVRKIFRVLVKSTKKPVTLKIRTGITKPDCFLEIAKIAEEEGIAMITLHARTLKQGYSGKADWSKITELKKAVKIPVVGNGDIKTPEDALRMLNETACDYVMVGRAAMGNPYLFRQIDDYLNNGKYSEISLEERKKYFWKYLDSATTYRNISFASIKMRAMDFTKGMKGGAELRKKISKVKSTEELKELLK